MMENLKKLERKSITIILSRLQYEAGRIFGVKQNLIFLILFCMVGLFFVYTETASPPLGIFFENFHEMHNISSAASFTGFAGLFFFFGSLFMAYLGLTSCGMSKNGKYFFNPLNVLFRLAILDVFFLGYSAVMFYFVKILKIPGIGFSPAEEKFFFAFVYYLLIYLSFFFAAGLFLRVLSQKKLIAYISVFGFWLVSVFIIPGFTAAFLYKQSMQLPTGEKPDNLTLERTIRQYEYNEYVIKVYPTLFSKYLSVELSLNPHSLPPWFRQGETVTFLYTLALLLASYIASRKRFFPKLPINIPQYRFRDGNTYFILCKDDRYKNDFFNWSRPRENTVCIDRFDTEDDYPGFGLDKRLNKESKKMIEYFITVFDIERTTAWKNLGIMGITPDIFAGSKGGNEKIPGDVMQRILCAILTSGRQKIIVVNDVLKGKSKEFESRFLQLVSRMNESGKVVVYLGTEMFSTSLPFEKDIHLDSYASFNIDPKVARLR